MEFRLLFWVINFMTLFSIIFYYLYYPYDKPKSVDPNVPHITLRDGRILAYQQYGDVKGAPVFYFHGQFGSRLENYLYGDTLAKEMHIHLIIVDRPGYGYSSFSHNMTFESFVDDIVQLAEKLGIKKFGVIGYSSGGPFATACAYKIPHRLTGVVIMNSLGPYTHGVFSPEANGTAGLDRYLSFLSWYAPGVLRSIVWAAQMYYKKRPEQFFEGFIANEYTGFSKSLVLEMKDIIIRNSAEGLKHPEPIAQDFIMFYHPWSFSLDDIDVNKLGEIGNFHIYAGEVDHLTLLSSAKTFAQNVKGSKLHVIPNGGHFLFTKEIVQEIFTLLL